MFSRVTRMSDDMIGPAATRHRRVALKRQHQGKQQRESQAKGSVQPHKASKHTTARGILHAARAHLAVGWDMNGSLGVWDGALIAVKALTYAGALCAAGAVFFLGYCGSLVTSVDRSRIRDTVWGLSILSVGGGVAQIMVSAGSMSDAASAMWDGSLLRMIWQAGAGRANVIRDLGLMLAALGMARHRPSWWSLVGAVAAATSFAWSGHARALNPGSLPILLVSVHLLGVAFWLGALPALVLVARGRDAAAAAVPVARFGAAALFVVAGLMVAGLCLLWLMLGDFTELWRSVYGRYVMLKLAFVAALLCLAAFNKLRLTPRLLANDSRALQALRTSVRLELLMGVLILLATATLTTLTGPPALDGRGPDAAARGLQWPSDS
jgi:copper resistance protein D